MILLIKVHKLLGLDSVLEQEVVCMTIGFAHDAEIQIQQGQRTTSSKHHLYIGSVEQSFQCLCLFGLDVFFSADQIGQTVEVSINLLIHELYFSSKFFHCTPKRCMPQHTQQQVFSDHIFMFAFTSQFDCLFYNVFNFGIAIGHSGP